VPRLLFLCSRSYRDRRHFPTRRSSDLIPYREVLVGHANETFFEQGLRGGVLFEHDVDVGDHVHDPLRLAFGGKALPARTHNALRSEEHTSELQSRENLVCRLLLEKKKC